MKRLTIKISTIIFSVFLILSVFCSMPKTVFAESEPIKGADVYFIAGQSNAAGTTHYWRDYTGNGDFVINLSDRSKQAEYDAGYNKVLYCGFSGESRAKEAGQIIDELTIAKSGQGIGARFIGSELGLAKELQTKYANSDRTAIIIKYAVGAASLDGIPGCSWANWCPPSKVATSTVTGENLYFNMVGHEGNDYKDGEVYKYLSKAVDASFNDFRFKGFFWLQGEAESGNITRAEKYGEYLTALINDFRSDLGKISTTLKNEKSVTVSDSSKLPFIISECAPTFNRAILLDGKSSKEGIREVINQERAVASSVKNVKTIDTTEYEIKSDPYFSDDVASYCYDQWHYNADDMIEIGIKGGEFFTTGAFKDYAEPSLNNTENKIPVPIVPLAVAGGVLLLMTLLVVKVVTRKD